MKDRNGKQVLLGDRNCGMGKENGEGKGGRYGLCTVYACMKIEQ
jgi:hypothetical protein